MAADDFFYDDDALIRVNIDIPLSGKEYNALELFLDNVVDFGASLLLKDGEVPDYINALATMRAQLRSSKLSESEGYVPMSNMRAMTLYGKKVFVYDD